MKKIILIVLMTLLSFSIYSQATIKLAVPDGFRPLSYVDDGRYLGFFTELATDILRKNGYRVEYYSGTWSECLDGVMSGKYDLLGLIQYTSERDKALDYTHINVLSSWTQIAINKNSKLDTVMNLDGKTIGVIKNDNNVAAFEKYMASFSVEYEEKTYITYADVEKALANNEIFAAPMMGMYRTVNPQVINSSIIINPAQLYFVTKEQSNKKLLSVIDEYLASEKNDLNSEYHKLFNKYFNQKIEVKVLPQWFIIFIIVLVSLSVIVLSMRKIIKEKTKALEESNEKFKYLYENMSQGTTIYDKDGNILSINKAAEIMLGVKNKTAKKRTSIDEKWKLIKIDGSKASNEDVPSEIVRKTHKEASNILGEYNEETDSYIWLSIRAIPVIRKGEYAGCYAVFDDITKLKEKEEELIQKEKELTKIIDFMPNAFGYHKMLFKDGKAIDYEFIRVNEQFEKMTGFIDSQGKKLSKYYDGDVSKWVGAYEPVVTENKVLRFESYDDSLKKWFDILSYKVDDDKFVVIFNDISDKMKREEDLMIAHQELEMLNEELESRIEQKTIELKTTYDQLYQNEKMASLGSLVSGIAHEINTPLGAIMAAAGSVTSVKEFENILTFVRNMTDEEFIHIQNVYAQFIKNQNIIDIHNQRKIKQNIKDYLKNNGINIDSMTLNMFVDLGVTDISEDVLFLLKSPFASKLENVGAIASIFQMMNLIQQSAEKISKIVSALRIYSHQDEIEKKVKMNVYEQIESLLVLYYNKMKYNIEIERDYDVNIPEIYGYPDKLNQVFVNLLNNALQAMEYKGKITIEVEYTDELRVSITDTGPGIPEEIQEKIFTPFFTTKKTGEGSGLGLSISKTIVEMHGGRIYFNTSTAGTKFSVYLPVKKEQND